MLDAVAKGHVDVPHLLVWRVGWRVDEEAAIHCTEGRNDSISADVAMIQELVHHLFITSWRATMELRGARAFEVHLHEVVARVD